MNLILRLRQKFPIIQFIAIILVISGCDGIHFSETTSFAGAYEIKGDSKNLNSLDRNDISRFFKSIHHTLPLYIKSFKTSATKNKLPWQLIASVAYQESHWDAEAMSFTGVRGLMQLTTETADHMEIEDRSDPHQSIQGGSKYLRYLINKIPNTINSTDRIHLALAAYNIGFGHLRDAQKLAEQLGRNPNSWKELKEVLPLLADNSFSQNLEFGSARGYETVEFVDRVNSFYDLMKAAR